MNPQTDAHGKPLPEVRCPNCQHLLNCASAPNDDFNRPKPGDLSICIQCGTVLTFTPTMELRRLSPSEFAALDPESKHLVSRVLGAMRQVNRRN